MPVRDARALLRSPSPCVQLIVGRRRFSMSSHVPLPPINWFVCLDCLLDRLINWWSLDWWSFKCVYCLLVIMNHPIHHPCTHAATVLLPLSPLYHSPHNLLLYLSKSNLFPFAPTHCTPLELFYWIVLNIFGGDQSCCLISFSPQRILFGNLIKLKTIKIEINISIL